MQPALASTLRHARALRSLWPAVTELCTAPELYAAVAAGVERGYFRPADDERIDAWFARFLSVRAELWSIIGESAGDLGRSRPRAGAADELRPFLCGYAAACLVVTLDRTLLERVATHTLAQRKLNEERPESRIPRKQYTAIFDSFTDVDNAVRMRRALRWVDAHRAELHACDADPELGELARSLEELEADLDPSARNFLRLVGRYLSHAFRRFFASGRQRTAFGVLESGGRLVSSLHDRWTPPRVTPTVRAELEARLRPGDVLVTRHDVALTNLFLPGYWPHAALYVGSPEDRERLGIRLDAAREAQWTAEVRTLEALKDGVRFRPLAETLSVDAVVAIRPRLPEEALARAIERAALHEGKLYNFDFDFFRGDRLVCTEVVYRAFDGLEGFELPLSERAGRPALSAENLLDHALAGELFEPVAMYGAPSSGEELVEGPELPCALADTYKGARPS